MADSAVVGVLRVLLTANSAEFEAAMKKATDSVKVWTRDLQSIGRQAQDVGAALTKTLTLPIAGLAAGSVKAASDFESSFAGIRKTVGDATDAMGDLTPVGRALAQGMRELAKEIPINVNELNRIGEAAGQLGIRSENIMGFTRVMADLGVTTNLSSDQAATALARLANITGMPQDRFEELGNVIVHLGNNLATTEAEIVEFGLRIAGAGKQVGLTEGQILAFGAALSSVGINAEAGGTAISKVFIELGSEVANGGEKLEKFAAIAGMTAEQFAQKFRTDAAGATVAFVEGLGRIRQEGGNVFGVIEDLGMSEIRLRDALLRASGAGDLLRNSLTLQSDALRDGNALSKEAEQRYRTFENQLKLFWSQVRDVGIELGQVLLPVMRQMLTNAQPLIYAIGQLAQLFAALPAPVQQGAIAAGALVAALGPVLWTVGQLTTSLAAVVGAFGAKGIAVRALTPLLTAYTAQVGVATTATKGFWAALAGPLGIAAAITATGVAFAKAKDDWTRFFDVVIPPLGLIRAGLDALKGKTVEAAASTKPLADGMKMLASHGTSTAAAFKETEAAIIPVVPLLDQVDVSTKKVSKALEELSARSTVAFVPLKAGVVDFGATLHTVASGSLAEFAEASARANSELQAWANANGAVFAPSIQAVGTAIEDAAKKTSVFSGILDNLGDTIVRAFQGGGDVLKSIGSSIGKQLGDNLVSRFGESIKGSLGNVLGGAFTALIPGLGTLLGPLLSSIGGWFKKLFGGPSAEELAGREVVANFERNVQSMLTKMQAVEAGNESWKKTVIVVRDAYLAMGRTEAEALAAVERLWKSSKQGAEAVEAAIKPIQEALDFVKAQADDTGVSMEGLGATGTESAGEMAGAFSELREDVGTIGSVGERVALALEDMSQRGQEAVNELGEAISRVPRTVPITFVGEFVGPDMGDFGGITVPQLASGGIVTAPTLAMIGEGQHAEAVIPLDGREQSMFGGAKLQAEISGLRQDMTRFMRNLPRALSIAQQDALLLAGRSR